MYKHINVSQGTFSIKDSKGVCYALGPRQVLILDKNNEVKGMIEVEKIEQKTNNIKQTKVKKHDSSNNTR